MKVTMYELLGMVKDGKTPKKIMYNNVVWEYVKHKQDYRSRHNAELFFNDEINNTWIMTHLNTQIEILEEENKIPEKLEEPRFNKGRYYIKDINGDYSEISGIERTFRLKINEIIDYLKSKGE